MKAKKHLNLRILLWWPDGSGWRRLARALVPNPGTLIILAVFLLAQSAGALPLKVPATTSSSTTTTISYQGRLADSSGNPITSPGVAMQFRLYNVDTGGAPLWEETHAAVPVEDGLFHVLLGSTNPIPVSLLASNSTLWLGITVGSDSEMTPREQIASVPYAMASEISRFGGRPHSYPYVLHLRHFALAMGNFCYGYVPGDPGVAGHPICDSYPGLDRFTAGLKLFAPSGNGDVHAANNLPIKDVNFGSQTVTESPRWGYAYSFFLNNPGTARSFELPMGGCNDVAVYVTTGEVAPDRLGNSVSLQYHRFPGNSGDELLGCPCEDLNPVIEVPAGLFRLTVLTRGAGCTSYLGIGKVDNVGLPIGNWIQEAGFTVDWPSLRTYLGEQ